MRGKKPKTIEKIMISGYYGFNNTGDEAILQSIVRFFKKRLPLIKIIVLSHNPQKTSQAYKVRAINRLNLFQILYFLKDTDLFISGGGGLLQDTTGKGWSVLYYLGLIWWALLFKIPVVIYAQGIGPLHKKLNKLLIKYTLNKVDLITLRENNSRELLVTLGISKPPMYIYADPCFLLKRRSLEQTGTIFKEIKELSEVERRLLIGLSLRETKDGGTDFQKNFARIADDLIENYQGRIVFLPFKFREDVSISTEILMNMRNQKYARIINEDLEPEEWLSIISQLSLVIGMRLHSVIFSCQVSTPFIALNYDPKIRYFVESLSLPELLLEYNHISFPEIKKRVEYILENKDDIKKVLTKKTEEFERKAQANNHLLLNFFKFPVEEQFQK